MYGQLIHAANLTQIQISLFDQIPHKFLETLRAIQQMAGIANVVGIADVEVATDVVLDVVAQVGQVGIQKW